MKNVLAVLALSLLSWTASAHSPQPAWVCGIEFQGRASGVQFFVGQFKTEATGQIRCTSANGARYHRNVRITMGQSFLAPAIGIGDYAFAGGSAGISLFTATPDSLLGDYLVEDGRAALLGGIGAFVAEKLNPPQLAIQVSMQLLHGVGFDVGIHRMSISAM